MAAIDAEAMMAKRPGPRDIAAGCVRRGFRFRAYPTAGQRDSLAVIQAGLFWCWNTMCQLDDDANRWRIGWAIANRRIAPRPQRPDYASLPTDAARAAAKREHHAATAEWWLRLRECTQDCKDAEWFWSDWQVLLDDPDRERRSKHARLQDYQVFDALVEHGYCSGPESLPPVFYRQALIKIYRAAWSACKRGQRPPKPRKRTEDMPLVVGSGQSLRLEALGPRPRCPRGKPGWLNASIKMPGVPGRIACRIGPEQMPIIESSAQRLEGVSLVHEADGWYAAIRHDVPEPMPLPFVPGTACGIDVGLVKLAVLVGDDERVVSVDNPRLGWSLRRVHAVDSRGLTPTAFRRGLRERIAKAAKAQDLVLTDDRQDEIVAILSGQREGEQPIRYIEHIAMRQAARLEVSRLQCRSARNVRQLIRERLFQTIDSRGYERLYIEDLSSDVGQQGLHVSGMRLVASMLRQRYGDRVIELDAYLSSHQCSRCGSVSEHSWSDRRERVGHCESCGHTEDSDTNAARVMLQRGSGELQIPTREVRSCKNPGDRSNGRKHTRKPRGKESRSMT